MSERSLSMPLTMTKPLLDRVPTTRILHTRSPSAWGAQRCQSDASPATWSYCYTALPVSTIRWSSSVVVHRTPADPRTIPHAVVHVEWRKITDAESEAEVAYHCAWRFASQKRWHWLPASPDSTGTTRRSGTHPAIIGAWQIRSTKRSICHRRLACHAPYRSIVLELWRGSKNGTGVAEPRSIRPHHRGWLHTACFHARPPVAPGKGPGAPR
jgi:hypothetical protein